jgi:uncharacterized membrane protein
MRSRGSTTGKDVTQQNIETIAALEKATQERRTKGEALADRFSAIVGSWPFILGQGVFLLGWILLNLVARSSHWDPYPFILLNLVLSFQAAFASPIIMMSQNRQGRLAMQRNQLDLQINLLAEQESTQTLRLLRRLCQQAGVELEPEVEKTGLEDKTHPADVLRRIEEVERNNGLNHASQ